MIRQPSCRKYLVVPWLLLLASTPSAIQAADGAGPVNPGPKPRMEVRAQLVPLRHTIIGAGMDGRISSLAVAEGDRFSAGQPLVRFDCSTQLAELRKAEVEVRTAVKSQNAKEKLYKLNAIGELELELASAAVERAEAQQAAIQTLLSKCRIDAPYAGRVAEQRVREEQFVRVGEPLLDILDDSDLELQFIVPSEWLVWLKSGRSLRVAIDETGRSYPAKVSRIGPRIDPVSQTAKISALIMGAHPDLLAGMSGVLIMDEEGPPR